MTKKACFIVDEKVLVDFKLRLRHDGLNQSRFLSKMIELYITNDADFQVILSKLVESSKYGKKRRKKTLDNYKKGNLNKKQFQSITEGVDIYDLIEKELGDL